MQSSFPQKITEIAIKREREEMHRGKKTGKQTIVTIYRNVNVAAVGRRLANYFLDKIFITLLHVGLTLIVSTVLRERYFSSQFEDLIFLSFYPVHYLISIPYFVLSEFFFQRSPAKFITSTRVIDEFCNRPNGGLIFARTFCRLIPFNGLSFFFSERGWHDKNSKTWVVTNKEYNELRRLINEGNNRVFPDQNFI